MHVDAQIKYILTLQKQQLLNLLLPLLLKLFDTQPDAGVSPGLHMQISNSSCPRQLNIYGGTGRNPNGEGISHRTLELQVGDWILRVVPVIHLATIS